MDLLSSRELCEDDNRTPLNLSDFYDQPVGRVLAMLTPSCSNTSNWDPVDTAWVVFFYLHVVIFAVLFLLIGIACVILLCKHRQTIRFAKAHTFATVNITLLILGFSRTLFYVLDPYGLSGVCNVLACTIISRLLFSLGFPSLTASYTLVFLTLWQSARIRLGKTFIGDLRKVIPFTLIHYIVALTVEIVTFIGPYSVIFIVIACEIVFALWGMVVCVIFLTAGIRLLKSVQSSARTTTSQCRGSMDSNAGQSTLKSSTLDNKRDGRMRKHHKQAIFKVSLITYSAAVLGVLYSINNVGRVIVIVTGLFGSVGRGNPNLWLAQNYIAGVLEIGMAVLMLYSVNDIRPLWSSVRASVRRVSRKRMGTAQSINNGKDYTATMDRPSAVANTGIDLDTSLAPNHTQESESKIHI